MTTTRATDSTRRWPILLPCILAMLAIANLQYAWTFFTTDIARTLHAQLDAVHWRCDEVVPGSTRSLCRGRRRFLWVRHGTDHPSYRLSDRAQRLSHGIHRLWRTTRTRRALSCAVPPHASNGLVAGRLGSNQS